MITIQVRHPQAQRAIPRDLRARIAKAWTSLGGAGEVTVCISDDAHVRELNAQFRHKDRVTDVLSFPYDAVDDGVSGGDIIIAWDYACAQAAARNITPRDELLRLIVHGLAHLQGYQHETLEQFTQMREVEAQMLFLIL